MEKHQRNIKCKHCDETFDEFWKVESHMKTHMEGEKFESNKCSKKFQI